MKPKQSTVSAEKPNKPVSHAKTKTSSGKPVKENRVFSIGYYHGRSAKVAEIRVMGYDCIVMGEMELQIWVLTDAKGTTVFSIPASALVYCLSADAVTAPSAPVLTIK